MSKTIYWLLLILMVLITLDGLTTYIGLANRKAVELNPRGFNMTSVMIRTTALIMFSVLSIYSIKKLSGTKYVKLYYYIVVFLILFYVFVIFNNLMVIR